ncbi:hypothetical protein [Paenibacillus larvae]|uniref:hypothetical protein n=1 Tax=Paenibacillus larvae TaxID=1464 RepID=UPI002853F815|nr:hypothetical protein [Paenibacillus larvae]MDR5568983.1 hypothetical protein [Paenibacillus larvae]
MRYGIKLDGVLEETYDTPEEAYYAVRFRYGDTGLFYEVVAVTSLDEKLCKMQEELEAYRKRELNLEAYRKRELNLLIALMGIKKELAWGEIKSKFVCKFPQLDCAT